MTKTNKQILRKEISRDLKDGIETVKNKYFEQMVITDDEYNEIYVFCDGDYELAYYAGLGVDIYGDIVSIDIDNLITALAGCIKDTSMIDEQYNRSIFIQLRKKLIKWKGYTLYIEKGDEK
ncbi:MAG: hypothetical protein DRO96_01500 [Candidatus Aenigmatarchaeota archaeon]|nr:MAG: hypothetical protein DRO96_01500 [Candidatus Aenigmarchaeota archaeon]